MSDTLPPMPEPWTAQSEIKCAACGRPYKPALVRPCIGETPQSGCECGSVSFTAMVGYDSPSPAQYTADQMRTYAAAAVADATKRLQIELENVRAEGLLLAKSEVAMERERCANVVRYWLAGYAPASGTHEAQCVDHILVGRPASPLAEKQAIRAG